MQAKTVPTRVSKSAPATRRVGSAEFVELLTSRRKLERDLRLPHRLVCRETGTVYVLEKERDPSGEERLSSPAGSAR